jgi:hypothetical protein
LWIWLDVCGSDFMFVDLTSCLWIWIDVCEYDFLFVDMTWCLWIWLDVCGFDLMFVEMTWCLWIWLDDCGFVHYSIIHKRIQQNATMYQNFISYLYKAQHVSGDTPPIIRGRKLHSQPLVFYKWMVVGRVVAGRCQLPATTRPTTLHL